MTTMTLTMHVRFAWWFRFFLAVAKLLARLGLMTDVGVFARIAHHAVSVAIKPQMPPVETRP